jgi:cell wall-associated NlpC family hydrolase
VAKTVSAATESTIAAVVPAVPEATIENAPIRVAAQSPDSVQSMGAAPQETAAPVQVAMLLPESEAATAPVSAAPANQVPQINRNLNRNERIARSALSYRGVPYRMGATGRGAFDCSGFMMYLFDKEGLELPRTAAQQYKKGIPIPKNQMKPGDLVFFKNTYKRGVSHVGIYIGGGKFCHASSGGHAVRTDSLNKPYYVNHWAGARRPR